MESASALRTKRRAWKERSMNRRPLGRGLDALIPNSAAESNGGAESTGALELSGGTGFQMVAPDRIRAGRFQPRQQFDQGRLEELAVAIRAQGIIEPLVVRPDGDGYE